MVTYPRRIKCRIDRPLGPAQVKLDRTGIGVVVCEAITRELAYHSKAQSMSCLTSHEGLHVRMIVLRSPAGVKRRVISGGLHVRS